MTAKTPPAAQGDLPEHDAASETRGAPSHHGGRTTTLRDERGAHPLPHERDESTSAPAQGTQTTGTQDGGTQGGGPRDVGRRAQQDVQRGVGDTSRAEATDETYARELREGAATPPQRRAPSGERH